MSERNDQDWLEALAGRGSREEVTGDVREAQALREAILHRTQAEPEPVERTDREREDALIARARREGVLDPEAGTRQTRAPAGRASWASGWRSGLAFAAFASLFIAVGLWLQPEVIPESARAVDQGVVRIEARDPAALKRQIIGELRAVGVEATGYEVFGRQGVDADLPAPLAPRVRGVLERHRIPAPADGVLRVEIVAPGHD